MNPCMESLKWQRENMKVGSRLAIITRYQLKQQIPLPWLTRMQNEDNFFYDWDKAVR